MKKIEKHVNHILKEMQSTKEEREEIREELTTHLTSAKQKYINEGESEKRAEKLAIKDFGDAGMIGGGIQESLYPFQRGLLYMIGAGTILLGIFIHLTATFSFGDPWPGWLAIQMSLGMLVVLTAINISWTGQHYWSVNVIVFLTILWNAFNYMVVPQFYQLQVIIISLFIGILILLCLIFIVRNSYYATTSPSADKNIRTVTTISHIINIIYGLMISGAGLFITWGALVFGGMNAMVFMPLTAVAAWLAFYKYQMNMIGRKPVTAIFTGLLFCTLIVGLPLTLLSWI
ncbi:permease prefix domain 1-containing protein [Halobacillus kuroshimensis]|uniref:permease prefix domain 1-containing protein n=1 Tax=Halobacillus kuroshimensis TaxID=302481 RepID=UPI00041EC466|nr:permease prefix domain 1-containing protein [Halobacillus kuroshimensis]